MKYKVGDEVFVRCKIINVYPGSTVPYEVVRTKCNPGFEKPLYILAGDEDIVDMSADEAWEIAKRICTSDYDGCDNVFSRNDLNEIFGNPDYSKIMNRFTSQEAKAKIEAWEAEKEIKVGDVVTFSAYEGIVTRDVDEQGYYALLLRDGDVGYYQRSSFKKTGRHIDIDEILKQIGGSDA